MRSTPGYVKCGVPQGSILGPLFFILYVNGLPVPYLYADDTTIAVSGTNNNVEIADDLNSELLVAGVKEGGVTWVCKCIRE